MTILSSLSCCYKNLYDFSSSVKHKRYSTQSHNCTITHNYTQSTQRQFITLLYFELVNWRQVHLNSFVCFCKICLCLSDVKGWTFMLTFPIKIICFILPGLMAKKTYLGALFRCEIIPISAYHCSFQKK